ncbi:PfaD family polyunsaturated fatty acid/polyketide biosynthesis protein [Denitrobaculum tricleocarpae]|uniref:PfaD family polyunsaturated fatty acid/polyketide biosynthesis protein n=1 Tax=Denitrobaculum tricleocarpae TaxID=2591009 RepID=A0A545TNA2_9PROT|nr:PfaD family polyunsaturated fatty acid/polyketide biosynthesis protein [Denitrobaculum tricleocarpae]TQV78631.1 PfaD family polyunsaturated fatty acid/polyketide biosynthesis protein [Denitrobaculum tricleocarpae]
MVTTYGEHDVEEAMSHFRLEMDAGISLVGVLPGIYPEWLGSRRFTDSCGCRFPYVVGEMARGISSVQMVVASVRAGFVAFFGSGGLRPHIVADAIDEITQAVGSDTAWGANLIHSPDRPDRESAMVDLFLRKGVRRVSASAFMGLSKDLVRYAAKGLSRDANGNVVRQNHVFAKISRAEVAEPFMRPPPAGLLRELVAAGEISHEEAEIQATLPVAEFVTVESDSGGHTDNRPLASLFPVIADLRERIVQKHNYRRPIQLGAAGGLGTPAGVASAFGLGADYVLVGSANQSAVESGLSEVGRAMLCEAGIADVTMAPASDMFELGVKVQVLKRGTMFAVKAQRLYDLFRRHETIDAFSSKDREWLEKQVLREGFETAWSKIVEYRRKSDPTFAVATDKTPRQKMAQVFRYFLFMGSQWAREGIEDRRADFQIWCGPAMGAFNDWVQDSFLEPAENRTVEQIGLNLLEGAAHVTRAQQLGNLGMRVPQHLWAYRPQPLCLGYAASVQ